MRSSLLFAGVLIPACTDDFDGTYQVTRTVVSRDPAPQFDIKQDVAIMIDDLDVQVSTSWERAWDVMIEGTRLLFRDNEQWKSSEGDGAARLHYDLQRTDDKLIGTAYVRVSYHGTTGFFDFDYTLAIDGTKH